MLHTYTILKDYGLIVQNHTGPFTADDMKRVKSSVLDHPDFNVNFNFLVDLRDSQINMTTDELIAYENWLLSHPVLGDIKKFAIFTNTPQQFEKAIDYIAHVGIRVDHYKIFRTLGTALFWLGVDTTHKTKINEELKLMVEQAESI